MRCCTGVEGVCPPLAKWSDLMDGTYTICDVERFNQAIQEMVDVRIAQMNPPT